MMLLLSLTEIIAWFSLHGVAILISAIAFTSAGFALARTIASTTASTSDDEAVAKAEEIFNNIVSFLAQFLPLETAKVEARQVMQNFKKSESIDDVKDKLEKLLDEYSKAK
jgi:hypothetical protein